MELTENERDLLRLIAIGSTRAYAAVLLNVSGTTVARTLAGLYERTGSATSVELVSYLLVTGVLKLTPEDFPDCSLPETDRV